MIANLSKGNDRENRLSPRLTCPALAVGLLIGASTVCGAIQMHYNISHGV